MSEDEDFSAYVATRWPNLVRSAVLLGCSMQEAEDVAQTTLVRCYRYWRRVRQARDPDAYVYRSMVNVWRKSRRRRWWSEQATADPPETGISDMAEAVSSRQAVVAALQQLSEKHRTVLVLRYVADMSEKQVAEVLGLPVGTVKSRLSRALADCAAHPKLAGFYREYREHT